MAKQSKAFGAGKKVVWEFPYARKNFMIFGLGIVVILIGYMLMSTGISDEASHQTAWNNPLAVSVAPVVLVIGYCVIIPYAILRMFKDKAAGE
ncbi:MAG: DUF3098 domain-containing protein [Candidatus Kapaibacterium sp.]|jgi:NADH:ubiquinone oxidoreductase subunit 6 (subunit J)